MIANKIMQLQLQQCIIVDMFKQFLFGLWFQSKDKNIQLYIIFSSQLGIILINSTHKIMENHLSQLSKDELIQLIIKLQKQKSDLLQLLQHRDKKPIENPIQASIIPSGTFFSKTFSEDYYLLENNGSKATWLKESNNLLFGDYHQWPSVRTEQLITGVKTFRLRISGYGWIGLGSVNMRNDGFPGYTSEGWMLSTDGRVYHNKTQIAMTNFVKFQDKWVTITVDAAYSQITVDGLPQRMGSNLPKEVYFVVSIYGPRAACVEVEP